MSIYLDNSASTPVRNEVLEAMRPFLSDKWGNPSSVHKMGREARGAIEVARRQVAKLIGCMVRREHFFPDLEKWCAPPPDSGRDAIHFLVPLVFFMPHGYNAGSSSARPAPMPSAVV